MLATILLLAPALAGQLAMPPAGFTLNDSQYGNVTMTYDNVNAWRGVSSVSLPSNPCCGGGVNFALNYTLTKDATRSDWWLVTSYVAANSTTHCPVASNPGDPTNCSYWTRIEMAPPPPAASPSVTFAVNGTVPGTQAWPAYGSTTLKLNLP